MTRVLSFSDTMDTLLHRWLRPTHRARRTVVALVVVALLGWVSLSAGHVHLHTHVAHAADGAHDAPTGDSHGAGDGNERSHACSLCAAFERAAGPAAAPDVAVALGPDRTRTADFPDRLLVRPAATPYRSRAPPHA